MTSITLSKALAVATVAGAILLAGCAGVSFPGAGPVHTDRQFTQIQRGMTRDDVMRLLGPPDETMKFPLTQTESLDYHYTDTWGYTAVFSVTFDAGDRVVSTFSWRVNAGGDHASH